MTMTTELPVGDVVFEGVPFPQDGALFGWCPDGKTVAAVVACYAEETPPVFSSMPRTDAERADWQPIVRPKFGWWFWNLYRQGLVVDLATLIGTSEDVVFWVDTRDAIGSSCMAVERDLRSPEGWTLPRGAYGWYRAAEAGTIPSLETLLGDPGAVDLGPRFEDA